MKILFMGTPDFAVPSLAGLLDDGHEIVGVFTQPDKPQGRKMKLTPPPVKELALAHGLPVYQPETMRDGAVQELLDTLSPELIVVVAYGKILPEYVLNYPQHGCINVHGSLLPRWRGAAPIQWSVIAGDQYAGVTTMKMAKGLDTGDMLLTYKTEIGSRETAGELFDRLAVSGAELLLETIHRLPELIPIPQNETQANYASMLDKDLAKIDWTKDAHTLDCLIRGLNPWPVAYTTVDGDRVKIFSAEPEQGSGEPGTILLADPKHGFVIACGEGALRIGELQPVGKKCMDARDYLRGHALELGCILGE